MAATVVSFGEWLPDLPDLGNPGLIDATNVEPQYGCYTPYKPLIGGTSAPTGISLRGYATGVNSGSVYYYAGMSSGIQVSSGGAFASRSTITGTQVNFVQFDDLMVAAAYSNPLHAHTIGAATNFATLTGAPSSVYVGRINKFLIAGALDDGGIFTDYLMRWSGLDLPNSWPTPASATATAQQSGQQFLNAEDGAITGFANGDQFGLVFQRSAVTRITYVGPPVVFQFDRISDNIGCKFPRSIIQVGSSTFFISHSGFCVTDGVTVTNIGHGKVNEYFNSTAVFGAMENIHAAHDSYKELIYWSTRSFGIGNPSQSLLIYNYRENRFSLANDRTQGIISTTGLELSAGVLMGYQESFTLGSFTGTAGAATITTGDIELNTGGRTYVDGIKPNVESTGTAPAITVRLGFRADLSTTPSYTATTTPTTRTGFADFHVDAKYHRAEIQMVGNFDKAIGIEVKAFATGEA